MNRNVRSPSLKVQIRIANGDISHWHRLREQLAYHRRRRPGVERGRQRGERKSVVYLVLVVCEC